MGLDPSPPPTLSLSHFFVSNFFQSILPCRRSYLCHLPTTRDPVFQLNEEPLTGQSGPVNLASKMAPKEKTLVKEKARKRKSPKGKEKATVIREEPEVNLFLECLQSINKLPMANIQPEQRRSSRHSQSKKTLTINTDRKIPQTERFNPPQPQPTTGSSLRRCTVQGMGGREGSGTHNPRSIPCLAGRKD